jgi:two-component system C4-dicarboxylate transport sensor histidine kinase DctB
MIRSSIYVAALYLLLSLAASFAVYQSALRTELGATRSAAQVRLTEAASRLRLQLDEFRALANFIAHEPIMAEVLHNEVTDAVRDELADFRLIYGAWHIDLVEPGGRIIASSSVAREGRTVSRSLVRAAMNGRLGSEFAVEDGIRLTRFSRGVLGAGSDVLGVAVVSADMAALEFEWPVTPEPVVFFDQENLSFVANRPELLGLSMGDDPEEATFPLTLMSTRHPIHIWRLGSTQIANEQVIRLQDFITPLNLRGEIYPSVRNARETAQLRFFLALASAIALGLIGAVAVQQRRRLALEARQSATLEARVEERSNELKAAQDELVKTSQLAAMGRLSAGISHELNQPLGAILNFSENGRKLLARKRYEPVDTNLSEISNQVRRITRIIGNLRAFARQEVAATELISIREAVEGALVLAAEELETAQVTTKVDLPAERLEIKAGQVRLEQVILNLITNAIDAMETSEVKTLSVQLEQVGNKAVLRFQDTGTGISDPTRVFEPFYTTKNLGASQGLGLGMSLSFGIVQQFCGDLRCRNLDQGAEFLVEFPCEELKDDQ